MNKGMNFFSKLDDFLVYSKWGNMLRTSTLEFVIATIFVVIISIGGNYNSEQGLIQWVGLSIVGMPIIYLLVYVFCRLFPICRQIVGLIIRWPILNIFFSYILDITLITTCLIMFADITILIGILFVLGLILYLLQVYAIVWKRF